MVHGHGLAWPLLRLGDEVTLPSREQWHLWGLAELLLQAAQTAAQRHTDLLKSKGMWLWFPSTLGKKSHDAILYNLGYFRMKKRQQTLNESVLNK